MGSWNKTCGLSNLHITAGKEAYVFVLEKRNDDNDGHCYATHLYKPLLLPFVTEYDDYGGGTNSHGPGLPFIMEGIKHKLHEVAQGDNKYHDIPVTKEGFGPDMFFEAVHEGRLFREGNFADPVRLEYVMFRKDIVDHILEHREIEHYVGGGMGDCGWNNNYIKYKFEDIVADILPMLQTICEKIDADRKLMGDDFINMYAYDSIENMFSYNDPNHAARWLRGDGYRYCRIVNMEAVFRHLFENPTTENVLKVEELLVEYLKGKFIDNYMELTRKSWIPAGHEGSQSSEISEYRLLIDAMTTALDAEEAYYKELNGE